MSESRSPRSAASTAYDFIAERLGVRFKPGDRLPLDEIAHELGMSRQPVRDAVQRLAAEGLVTVVAQVGSVVREIEPTELRDLATLLRAIDGDIASLAAERFSDVARAALESTIVEIERLVRPEGAGASDPDRVRAAAKTFQGRLQALALGRSGIAHVGRLRGRAVALARVRFYDRLRDASPVELLTAIAAVNAETLRGARALLAALCDRDAARAAEIARSNVARMLTLVETGEF